MDEQNRNDGYIFGRNNVIEALRSGREIDKIFVIDSLKIEKLISRIKNEITRLEIYSILA